MDSRKIIAVYSLMLAFVFSVTSANDVKYAFERKLVFNESRDKTPLQKYGTLKVIGKNLCDSRGRPVQLRGISSHGLQWFGTFAEKDAMKELRDYWGITVFRAAMYVEEGGYISNPELMSVKISNIVKWAKELGIYVIIDWHILNGRSKTPTEYTSEAKEFFTDMAAKFGGYQNILYEICNEPNGNSADWGNIKEYAGEIIPAIRAVDSDSVIIVGTPTWSQDVHKADADPLKYPNLMYACHFYVKSHGQWLRDRVASCVNIAIFATEWGTTDYTGDNGVDAQETADWIEFMRKRNISWCNWSLCDKNEDSALLNSGASSSGPWNETDVSESGKMVKYYLK